jgi:energy-converting hydrogenase Eha subunit C
MIGWQRRDTLETLQQFALLIGATGEGVVSTSYFDVATASADAFLTVVQ